MISDERFAIMSKEYEDEQSKLKQAVNEFTKFIETNEQKHTDVEQFLKIVRNRTEITELTPEIMHEFNDFLKHLLYSFSYLFAQIYHYQRLTLTGAM